MLYKKTKVVCTIGPSSWDPEVMKQMIENGMNCARVNGAFADPDELDKVKKLVKDVSDEVSLMVDVKGPEVRLNKFGEPKSIKPGDEVIIGNSESDEIYPSNYENLYTYLKEGQRMVIGDGDVELVLKKIEGDQMHCEVAYGELLKPGKALNLPGADYSTEILTEKDKVNLKHAIETGWDFVSASFMNTAEAAQTVKDFIGDADMKIIAKIEDQEGIDNIDEILEIVDGIMVARGGLGIEVGLEHVGLVERLLIQKCIEAGKPVITATQMLESMIENPRPTRAEVSDVTTAILLGSDAVMLSGESSAGQYPTEAVRFMTSIADTVEPTICPEMVDSRPLASNTADAITKAAAEMCINMEDEIDSVIVVSKTGTTARLLARHSIVQPILAYVSNDFYARTLMLTKNILKATAFEGVKHDSPDYNRDVAVKIILDMAKEQGLIQEGQKVLFIGKTQIEKKGYFPNLFELIEV